MGGRLLSDGPLEGGGQHVMKGRAAYGMQRVWGVSKYAYA